jgi:dolichol-phosphate mannosyltransferase
MKKYKENIKQFLIFALGGGVNFVLNTVVTYLLTDVLGIYYLYSYIIVQIIIIVYGYLYNSYVTFRQVKPSKLALAKFIFLLPVFAVINVMLVKILTDWLGIYYVASIILAIFITIVGRFYIYKKWVFRND